MAENNVKALSFGVDRSNCGVPRVTDRRVINGIVWLFRTGPQ